MNTNAALGNNAISAPSIQTRIIVCGASVAGAVRHAALRETTCRELVRLTDHELRNIGLVRGDNVSIIRKLQRTD